MISVVIPNTNGLSYLKDCYESLRRQAFRKFEVIMIDNNSADNSVKFTQVYYPEIKILQLNKDKGFAGAANEGINFSLNYPQFKFILVLNSEVECSEDFLLEVVKSFKTDDTGSVACKTRSFYNRMKIENTGSFISRENIPCLRGRGEIDQGQFNNEEYIFGAGRSAAVYGSEVFDAIGFFDEDLFEDFCQIDFNLRLQLGGFKCSYNPKAVCYSKSAIVSKDQTKQQVMFSERDLVNIRLKNYPSKLLIKSMPQIINSRVKRYYIMFKHKSLSFFFSAVKGYFQGLLGIPGALRKRKEIQKTIKADMDYINALLS